MIKVEHTKTHTAYLFNEAPVNVTVTDAKLVLVEVDRGRFAKLIDTTDGEVTFNLQPNDNAFKLDKSVKECHIIPVKPILISETEKIEVGDWVYDRIQKRIYKYSDMVEYSDKLNQVLFKILALPEHFSPTTLQMIVDGKLKEGKVLVECEEKCWCMKPQSGGCIECTKLIKLNSHITIYPVEEKMVPLSLLEKAFDAGFNRAAYLYDEDHIDGEKEPPSKHEWFEQNVK